MLLKAHCHEFKRRTCELVFFFFYLEKKKKTYNLFSKIFIIFRFFSFFFFCVVGNDLGGEMEWVWRNHMNATWKTWRSCLGRDKSILRFWSPHTLYTPSTTSLSQRHAFLLFYSIYSFKLFHLTFSLYLFNYFYFQKYPFFCNLFIRGEILSASKKFSKILVYKLKVTFV